MTINYKVGVMDSVVCIIYLSCSPCVHTFLQVFEDGCIEMMYLRDIEEYLVHICIWNYLEKGKGEGKEEGKEEGREGEGKRRRGGRRKARKWIVKKREAATHCK